MIASVGKDHLGAVLAEAVGHTSPDEPVGPEHGHHVAREGGAPALATLHRRQVQITCFNLKSSMMKIVIS